MPWANPSQYVCCSSHSSSFNYKHFPSLEPA
jgi:hypothetical protein